MSEYQLVAQAGSFEELNQMLAGRAEVAEKGDKVRLVMQLNKPLAPAFNLAGAEILFARVMPEGLELKDVRGEGWDTVIVDAEADPIPFAVIGAWLAANWVWVTLGAIGIAVALGVLLSSVALLVMAATGPEAIPKTAMWIAIGLGALAVGAIVYSESKKKAPVGT